MKIELIQRSLSRGNTTSLIAKGKSMLPLITPGTHLTITPTTFSKIKISDTVAFIQDQKMIIHKCIFKTKDKLFTWGINNNFLDPPASPSQVLGIVTHTTNFNHINFNYQLILTQISQKLPHNVKFIILKGAPWQKFIFGHYLNQPVSDVDILIQPKDYPIIIKTLKDFDFLPTLPTWLQKSELSSSHPEYGEIPFSRHIKGITYTIDLHIQPLRGTSTKIISPLPKDLNQRLNQLFFRSTISAFGFNFLSPESELLYLCLNLFLHHALKGIQLYSYLAYLIYNHRINWTVFWQYVQQFHLSNYIYYPLSKTRYLFHLPIPKLKSHRPPLYQRLLIKIFHNKYNLCKPLALGRNKYIARLNMAVVIIMSLICQSNNNND